MKHLIIRQFSALSYAGQEAVNALCTNLTFSGENVKKIMITSSHSMEGKSFLAMNILRTMARYGKKAVLVDADLRMSAIASRFGFQYQQPDNEAGLAHFLAGMVDESDVVYATSINGAYIVPVGRRVSTPMPLLNSVRLNELLTHLAELFDFVLIDAPPVGAVIDAAEIAKSCDGVLVVVSYDDVHRQELLDVKLQLEQTGCPVIGAVLNQVEKDDYFGRKYYKSYYSEYGSDARKKGRLSQGKKGVFRRKEHAKKDKQI